MDKQTIVNRIDQLASEFIDIAAFIGENPELGHEEWKASARLKEALERHGFQVQSPVLDLPTAFLATYKAAKPGPTIAFLCEYDALPELGHACGHHLIAVMGLAAAVGLQSVIEQTGGTIRVYGTPAEETKGAKVTMAAAGLFDDVDAALMAHPYYAYEKSGMSLAMDALQFEFHGKAAHAAASPYEALTRWMRCCCCSKRSVCCGSSCAAMRASTALLRRAGKPRISFPRMPPPSFTSVPPIGRIPMKSSARC